ncbi:thymocyte nuclear protein 1 isoform X2 [Myotis myotis]|uniref:thymocyte nuclear protein 1 isoform X2 n=1 Tax=Myotis myotis TaxID=51298 RepID=UPI00174D797B|nr:thymocyte nuclear protein 1 isoform X2 [Myotis myotis]
MPRPRKRLHGTAGQDKEGPAGKRTKAKNPGEAPATMEKSSPRETSALKKCGNNVSSYWLMKSEPESRLEKGVDVKFSIEDLQAEPKQMTCWDGVRNYQARNFLRAMKLGQEAFFYHSNCKEPGIAGLVKIVKEAYPDHTQFEKSNPHYDPSSKKDNPKWSMVKMIFPTSRGEGWTERERGGWGRCVCDRSQSSALTRTGLPRLWRTEHLQAANIADRVQRHVLLSHTLVMQVDVQFVRMMKRFIPLAELRTHHQAHKATGGPLQNMALFTLQRLSVQPLTREEFDFILSLEEKEPS